MFRSVASNVSALSSVVANRDQTMQHVSSSLSKIPYGGFSPVRLQTGIRPRPSSPPRGLSARPAFTHSTVAYTRSKSKHPAPLALSGMFGGASSKDYPVQRPLALQRVMLSRRVNAYYGLIRASRSLLPVYVLYGRSLPYGLVWAGFERFPNFLYASFPSVPPSVPRRIVRLPLTVASPYVLAFASSTLARHPRAHANRFMRGLRNEAAKFASCYGPMGLLALHRQGLLLSSFHCSSRLKQRRILLRGQTANLPRPDLHRLDAQPYGLRAKGRKEEKKRFQPFGSQ